MQRKSKVFFCLFAFWKLSRNKPQSSASTGPNKLRFFLVLSAVRNGRLKKWDTLNKPFLHRHSFYDSCVPGTPVLGLKDRFQASAFSAPTHQVPEARLLTGDRLLCNSACGRPRGSTHGIFITGLSFLKQSLGACGLNYRVSHENSWHLV